MANYVIKNERGDAVVREDEIYDWFIAKDNAALCDYAGKPFEFVPMTKPDDEGVFTRAEYRYGTDGRCNVGYGFWQMAFGSKATLDATNFSVTGESHYAEMVREARRQRRLVDGKLTDWIVVRNRLSTLGSRNKRLVGEGLSELSKRMGFRCIDGFAERVVYREFFPRGLTALDNLDETTLGTRPNMSHVTAREEVIALLNALHLPLSENGRRRAAARAEWYSVMDQPLAVHDVLA